MTTQKSDLAINRYTKIDKIGEGSFSKVYRVKDQQNKEYYAAKVAKFMINEESKDFEEVKSLFREINLLLFFDHPSILKFYGYYNTNFKGDPYPTLITELAINHSLRDIIKNETSGLSPPGWNSTTKLIVIYGIASGMLYLHQNNVLHRDLKSENILIDNNLHPKIADFGLSKLTVFLSENMNYKSQKGQKGTLAYMAPEILSNLEYSEASDVYAFGLIVYEIMTGKVPFENENMYSLMKKINDCCRPKISRDVPNSYRELIEKCWSQESHDRPSFKKIVIDLRENKEFITDTIEEAEFEEYVEYIDDYKSKFDISKRIHFSEFIQSQGRNSKSIEDGSNIRDEIGMYEYGKMLFLGEEIKRDVKECLIYMNKSKELGYLKAEYFIRSYYLMKQIEEFILFPSETQLIFINNNIKNVLKHNLSEFDQIIFKSKTTEQLYYNKSLSSSTFINCLKKYKKITIEIEYPTELFEILVNLVSNIRKYEINYIEMGIVFFSFEQPISQSCFEGNIIYHRIDKSVHDIIPNAFKGCSSLTQISIPSSVTSIGNSAFFGCSSLTQISIPSSVKKIGAGVFSNCFKLNKISICPSEEKLIDYFEDKFLIYKSGKTISNYDILLWVNMSYKIITIPSFIKIIWDSAFFFCTSLTQISIPSSVISIGDHAFWGCFSLEQISIPSSVTSIGENAFSFCSSLTQISIPSSVTSIGKYAFSFCSSLTQISIPLSTISIGEDAFVGCSLLKLI